MFSLQYRAEVVLILSIATVGLYDRFVQGFQIIQPEFNRLDVRYRLRHIIEVGSNNNASPSYYASNYKSCFRKEFLASSIQECIIHRLRLCSPGLKTATNREQYTMNTSTEAKDDPWWTSFHLSDESLPLSVRPQFPILSNHLPGTAETRLVYLDSAATSQKPTHVIDSMNTYYTTINANVHRGAHTLSRMATAQYEEARDKLASFLHAHSRNEIIFTTGATESINLVASTYGRQHLQPGDEILITEMEHHSNIVPWQMLAKEKNATLKFIPLRRTEELRETGQNHVRLQRDDSLAWEKLPYLLSRKTKIVSLQHVSNVMACEHPISDYVVPMVRKYAHPSVKIVLDACQSVPHMPIDVSRLGVDFLAASGHKMCGPTGIGILWGKEEILKQMIPYRGGGEMIDEVYMTHSTFTSPPGRFEAGTPNIANAIGLGAAVDYLTNIGMERIEAYEKELGRYLFKRMMEDLDPELGVTILGPTFDDQMIEQVHFDIDGKTHSATIKPSQRATATVAFVVDGVHPSDLSTFLDMEGIAIRAGHHCCQPLHRALGYSHSARASLYFYNTKEEVDFFIEKLDKTIRFLRGLDSDENHAFVPFEF